MGKFLRFVPTLAYLGCAALLLGQQEEQPQPEYGGPSILSRGLAPSNAPADETPIRPYVLLNGIFDNGLISPGQSANEVRSTNTYGLEGVVGLYGRHDWKHTEITLDYHGDYRHYSNSSFYNGSDQLLNLEVNRTLSRRSHLQLIEMGGTYSRNYLLAGIGALDPMLNLPFNELFDTRVNYFLTGANYTYQKSARLSFSVGGTGSLIRRQSSALYGVTGATARADASYRLTRYSTIGVSYEFSNFDFTKAVGSSGVHTASVEYVSRLSRFWELGVSMGSSRVESLFLRQVILDPEVAAILGETRGIERNYQINYQPTIHVRLSRDFRRAELLLEYSRRVMPGNGIYLTSIGQLATASFVYSGIQHVSLNLTAGYSSLDASAQSLGQFEMFYFDSSLSRRLSRDFFFVTRVNNRRYDTTYLGLRHWPIRVTVGVAWSPGDRPLTAW